MKTRFAKKIWARKIDRLSPYWFCQIWDYLSNENRDHRIDRAKRIVLRTERRKKNGN